MQHATQFFRLPYSCSLALYAIYLLILCPLLSCGKDSQSIENEVLARVGKATFKVRDLQDTLPKETGYAISNTQARSYVQRWINAELLSQEAKRRGLHKTAHYKRLIKNSERDLLANALLEDEIDKIVEASDDEIQDYFDGHQDNYLRSEAEVHALQILVSTLDEANQVRTQLRAGAPFDSLAKELSLDPSAAKGGDMGYFSRDQILPQLATVAFTQRLNSESRPVRTELGYHILKVIDRQAAGTVKDISQVKEEIRERLMMEKIRSIHREIISILRENAYIYTNYDILPSILADSSRVDSLNAQENLY